MNARKANLMKLRLPSSGNNDQRNEPDKANPTISKFFTTETKATELPDNMYITENSEPMPSPIEKLEKLSPTKATTSVPRTKLSSFIPKEKRLKPAVEIPISEFLTKDNSQVFEKPNNNIKKAPKNKKVKINKAKPRPKRQQNIKTAFLKNEELFSAVTAQHCIEENINPDEMQMALALSISEADVNGLMVVDEDYKTENKEEKQGIRAKLKKFGFRVAESEDYNLTSFMPLNIKSKWRNKFTALTLRDPKRQLEKVNQKVQEFLTTQFVPSESVQSAHDDEILKFSVQSEMLLPLVARDHIIIRPDGNERVDVAEFYVLSLFEPSKTKVGNLLKDVNAIAGRDKSPVKPRSLREDVIFDQLLQSPTIKRSRHNDFVSHAGLSLTCPNTNWNSPETLHDSVQPLPATISICPETISKSTRSRKITIKMENLPTVDFLKNAVSSVDNIDSSAITSKSLSVSTESSTSEMFEIIPKLLSNNEGCSNSQLQLSSIRSTSPDIFADSDVEMEADNLNVTGKINGSKSSSGVHNITIYETFSSDEAKTFLGIKSNSNHTTLAAIDLTQCGSDASSQQSDMVVPSNSIQSYQEKCPADDFSTTSQMLSSILDDIPSTSFKTTSGEIFHSIEKAAESSRSYFSFGSSTSEDFQKINSCNEISPAKAEDSIDLTQNDDDDGEYIILSDDEVNYSIWKTDKSGHSSEDEDFLCQNVTIDHLLDKELRNESDEKQEFSFLDLVATQPFDSESDQLEFSLKSKSNASLRSIDLDLSKRSDFGILEEQSPFKTPTKTQKKTPKKMTASTKCRRTLSESFIVSPVESSAGLKRFSSSRKFHEFTRSGDESLSDLDDIDKLIYGSPSKKAYRKPAGLDQLLTGTISAKIESPKKSDSESAKEFEFNGRTYLVQTNILRKPNYETMDESALLDHLYKYGIKPLKRKQAVKLLEYIFNQTHPLLVDETQIPSQSVIANCDTNSKSYEIAVSESKFNFKDCWGHVLVSDIDISMEIRDEQYIVQTNRSKKISTALLPFHIAWYNLVKSNKRLHEAILHYEPIDLQEIYLFFKGLGYRFDPKELKHFFDSRSIIFRYDLNKSDPSVGANRHVRKKRLKLTQPT